MNERVLCVLYVGRKEEEDEGKRRSACTVYNSGVQIKIRSRVRRRGVSENRYQHVMDQSFLIIIRYFISLEPAFSVHHMPHINYNLI